MDQKHTTEARMISSDGDDPRNRELVRRYRETSNPSILLELWTRNRGLVFKYINRFTGLAEKDDLQQESFLALVEAVNGFKEADNVPFAVYASMWIRWALYAFVNSSGLIHVPENKKTALRKYKRLSNECIVAWNREPTLYEIKHILGAAAFDFVALETAGSVLSLDKPIDNEDGSSDTLADILPGVDDITEGPERDFDREIMRRELLEALEDLPGDKGRLIKLKYLAGLSRQELAEQTGFTLSKIDAAIVAGRWKLRKKECCKWYYDDYIGCKRVTLGRFRETHTSEQEQYMLDHYY